jgi:nitrate reductase NapAB chaperone NapD
MDGAQVTMASSIRSYLVHTSRGNRDDVAGRLRSLPGCEVVAAANRDVVVVVSEEPGGPAQTAEPLEVMIARVPGVIGVSLVAGFDES